MVGHRSSAPQEAAFDPVAVVAVMEKLSKVGRSTRPQWEFTGHPHLATWVSDDLSTSSGGSDHEEVVTSGGDESPLQLSRAPSPPPGLNLQHGGHSKQENLHSLIRKIGLPIGLPPGLEAFSRSDSELGDHTPDHSYTQGKQNDSNPMSFNGLPDTPVTIHGLFDERLCSLPLPPANALMPMKVTPSFCW